MDIVLPWYWFDTSSGDSEPETKLHRDKQEADQSRKLLCHRCRHPITEAGAGIVFNGNHVHSRTNPAGITYDFGCYRNAPGCAVVGPPTREHSWFAGYAWQIALCGQCGEHMGWRFRGSDGFFGLVLGRLIDDQSQAG